MEEAFSDVVHVMVVPVFATEDAILVDIVSTIKAIFTLLALVYALSRLKLSMVFTLQ